MAHFRKGTPRGAERRALKAERAKVKKARPAKAPQVEQFPSVFPNEHPDVAGVGRTLSRGLPDGA